MANPYYSDDEKRAAKVNDLFTEIASRYDLINDAQSFGLHRLWKRRLIREARVRSGESALDVCCGTGDLAFALAKSGARTTGLDFNEPMLEIARSRLRQLKLNSGGQPVFLQGDAQQLPFPENEFDIVTVGYGLRNLADWELGVREMRRVLKPGGRLLALDFGKPENRLWRGIYFGYLKMCVPMFGRIFCGRAAAYSYILESLKHYPAQRGVEKTLHALEMRNVRTLNLLGGIMSINYGEKS
ncbi:MAG TPA: bifunctional demethylmenaquinone methyltransferase/2-methoxy-6-polyprenyl-1,4-benzoquinol methylase UbiE [Verrucomicrobiae bacterium]|nr:bifunctional demethylmenaquinone methyltransferase/2-methoxy-6-polyprenyl-1,4-benzoquinol methylase UbiE [Verrucomicrobiae bacterium]